MAPPYYPVDHPLRSRDPPSYPMDHPWNARDHPYYPVYQHYRTQSIRSQDPPILYPNACPRDPVQYP